MMDKELLKHKFIVFGGDHYNPLGIVRSLGEAGVKPIVILVSEHPVMCSISSFVSDKGNSCSSSRKIHHASIARVICR